MKKWVVNPITAQRFSLSLGEGRGEAFGLFEKRMPIDCSEIL